MTVLQLLRRKPKLGPAAGRRPGPRGWTGPGRGQDIYVQAPRESRGTTVQVPGLYPFAAGSSLPTIGVPRGRRIATATSPGTGIVCCDAISWWRRAKLISQPSEFVLGLAGLGKSTWIRKGIVGLDAYGVLTMVLGDLKGEYVDLIKALGGQSITVGRGRACINILDRTPALRASARLLRAADEAASRGDSRRAEELRAFSALVLEDSQSRRATMLTALLTILRKGPVGDQEEAILDRAMHLADDVAARRTGVPFLPSAQIPVIADVLQVIRDANPDIRVVAIDYGDLDTYRMVTRALEGSLSALITSGRFGGLFSRTMAEEDRPRTDRPVVYDVSKIPVTEKDLQAAVLLAAWSEGFGAINVQHALADAGLEPQRNYNLVMDELWRILRSGPGMVDLADGITRLNRKEGVGQTMCTHTMSDLELPDPADTAKARGFVERAGMVICAGLPPAEIEKLNRVVRLSRVEADLITSWTTPPAWDSAAGAPAAPPGQGCFLIKIGGLPGIPVHVDLMPEELDWNDTNKRWVDNGVVVPA